MTLWKRLIWQDWHRKCLTLWESAIQTIFSQAALSAVTYDQKLIGYPVYFDTSALVYNEDYLRTWATQQAEKELAGSSENDEPIGEGEEIIEEDSLPEDQTTEQVTADEAAVNALAEQYFAEALPPQWMIC